MNCEPHLPFGVGAVFFWGLAWRTFEDMKRLRFGLVLGAVALFLATGCDVVEDPIVPNTTAYQEDLYGPAPAFTPIAAEQHVLVEDFTAHQCGNCPAAAIIAEAMQASNPEKIAVMAIHAGSLAATDDDHFDTDWTTEEGDVFWNQLSFQANPLGRINRVGGPGNFFAPAQWEDQANAILAANDTPLGLEVVTDWVDEADHLNIHVHGSFVEATDGPISLAVLFLESGIIDYQLDYASDPEVVEDYEFKHVLRGSVNGALGLGFGTAAGGASAGDEVVTSYTFTWPAEWAIENATVLAVVSGPDGEVINVAETHPVE